MDVFQVGIVRVWQQSNQETLLRQGFAESILRSGTLCREAEWS